MAYQALWGMEERIRDALRRLRALREGDLAVLDLVELGRVAVDPLRQFVLNEPGGLFQPRCQAVEALAALGAKEVLLDFLAHPREAVDPVVQTGEEALANAVARSLAKWQDEDVFMALLAAGRHRPLAGIVEALGHFRRSEAIPVYDAALFEDFSRPEAEDAFRKLGRSVAPHLLWLTGVRLPSAETETESSKRRRRSALRLLAEMPEDGEPPAELHALATDADPRVALLACSICLPRVRPDAREHLIGRLVGFLGSNDWILAAEAREMLGRQSQ
jgi:hypothetical protein